MSIYRGESPSKTITRACFYRDVQRLLGTQTFKRSRHLVLCGDAGDVRHLSARGVTTITAIDSNEDKLIVAAKKYYKHHDDDTIFVCDDVTQHMFTHKFKCIFLDWCETTAGDTLEKSFAVVQQNLLPGGVFGLGFMYARDGLTGNTPEEKRKLRVDRVLQYMKTHKHNFKLESTYTYVSQTDNSYGSPLMYMLFSCNAGKHNKHVVHIKRTEADVINAAKDAFTGENWFASVGMRRFMGDTRLVADYYVLPYNRVGAWKAWETMRKNGTK